MKSKRKGAPKRRAKMRSQQTTKKTPTPIDAFYGLSERARENQIAVANGISLMRSDNLSAPEAAAATTLPVLTMTCRVL